jgi:hypothetical protein
MLEIKEQQKKRINDNLIQNFEKLTLGSSLVPTPYLLHFGCKFFFHFIDKNATMKDFKF